jgi:hypothetical protein
MITLGLEVRKWRHSWKLNKLQWLHNCWNVEVGMCTMATEPLFSYWFFWTVVVSFGVAIVHFCLLCTKTTLLPFLPNIFLVHLIFSKVWEMNIISCIKTKRLRDSRCWDSYPKYKGHCMSYRTWIQIDLILYVIVIGKFSAVIYLCSCI